MKYIVLLFIGVSTTFILSSCKKEAGEGGSSTIKGKVYAKYYNKSWQYLGEGYAPDERVYVIYGSNTAIGNDTRTSYDGAYAFNFLQQGSYAVYVYSDCDTCASGLQEVKMDVEINKNRQTVDAPVININRKK